MVKNAGLFSLMHLYKASDEIAEMSTHKTISSVAKGGRESRDVYRKLLR